MKIKLFDSERRVMEVLWENGDLSAGQLAKRLKEEIGWNRNTTYTVIKKCIDKGAIKRYEPNFMCQALISKERIQQYETNELIDKMFEGSTEKFFAAFLGNHNLSSKEIDNLKKLIEELK
ncbi:BlaI/MecI/CopY family transcriptional regulator [Vallitalea pronyensis]|uniref:BlaI/MecI/CopY family transcriptional regulator n=1 Tax=Vallitalea pronyensis TaxID=1348613 RepID=A0A8J8MKT4_9FIRM|nr:BlaI/MecI/CopY family transcriptional regulator [Vallitalea pronyensis]QUI23346.1 BlaI/MecI/CopY family transcriptional regulator [Vallitalea pronyensis]